MEYINFNAVLPEADTQRLMAIIRFLNFRIPLVLIGKACYFNGVLNITSCLDEYNLAYSCTYFIKYIDIKCLVIMYYLSHC